MAFSVASIMVKKRSFALLLIIFATAICLSFFFINLKDNSAKENSFLSPNSESNQISPSADINFTSTVWPMVRYDEPIVPNIVHFIKFGSTEILFSELVTFLSVLLNHKPETIMIHCDLCVNGTSMGGKYWEQFMARTPPVQVRHIQQPTHIFGQELSSAFHASDVARMMILMEHGGIYLDNDVYVINSLDHFRNYEMTLGWPTGNGMGTHVLLAHRNARFLRLWHDSYHSYNGTLWYYNAGDFPTESILIPKPYLVHRVTNLFAVHNMIDNLYKSTWSDWMDYFTVHLLIRHRYYMDEESPITDFNETNIRTYNHTFGEMARLVLFNTTDLL